MREVGEVRKRLAGDGAGAYIPIARKALGELKNLMKFQGLKQLVWTWHLADGTVVRVGSIHGHDFVDILAPPVRAFDLVNHGFICLPAVDGNSLAPTILIWREQGWSRRSQPGAAYGNVDWRGANGLALTWEGPPSRYANGQVYAGSAHIYFQGKRLASLPTDYTYASTTGLRIGAAAVTRFEDKTYLHCLVTNDTPGEVYLFRRLFQTQYHNDDLYDAQTNPLGWVFIGARSANQETLGQAFWYFNESGSEALSAGYKMVQDHDKSVKSSLLTTLTVSERSTAFSTTDYGYIKRGVEVEKTADNGTEYELLGYVYGVETARSSLRFFYSSTSYRSGPIFTTLGEARAAVDSKIAEYKAGNSAAANIGESYFSLFPGSSGLVQHADGHSEDVYWSAQEFVGFDYTETQTEVDASFTTTGFIRQDFHPYPNHLYQRDIAFKLTFASALTKDGEYVDEDENSTMDPVAGPGLEDIESFASATITRYALVRRTTHSLDHQEYQATFTGKYLAAADYQGDTPVLGLLEPTGTQSFIYDAQNTDISTNGPPVHHPSVGLNPAYWTFYFTPEESQDDVTKAGSSTLAIKCGDIIFHQPQATHDNGVITTAQPLFWDLRTGVYVLDKGEDSSVGTTTHTLVVQDTQEMKLASRKTPYTWEDTDYGLYGLAADTYFYYDSPAWVTEVLGNAGSDQHKNVLFSYYIKDLFAEGSHYYNYLTGSDPVQLTAISGVNPRFYPIGLF